MSNRAAVSIRFNLKEQANLRSLCQFWNAQPKDVIKLAFEQLVTATNELQNKLKANQATETQEQECEPSTQQSSPQSPSQASDTPSES